MANEPDTDNPLAVRITVEIVTYAIYLAWLSVIAGVALYLELPPLVAIERAVPGSWQGTAAAIAAGALSLAALRLVYDGLRARMPARTAEPPAPETPAEPEAPDPTATAAEPAEAKRSKKKKKKGKKSRQR